MKKLLLLSLSGILCFSAKVIKAQCTTGVVYAVSTVNQQTLVRLDTTTDIGTTVAANIFGGGAAGTMAAAGGHTGTSAIALDLVNNVLWFCNRGNATDAVPKIFSYNIANNTYGTTTSTFSGVTINSNINKAAYNPVDRNIYFHNASTNTLYRFNPGTPATPAVSLGTLVVSGVASPGGFSGGDIAFDGLGNLTGAFNSANILAICSVAFLSSGNYIVGSTAGSFKVSTNTGASTDVSATNDYGSSDFASCAAPAPNISASNTATRNCAGGTVSFTVRVNNTGDFHAINTHYRNPNPSGLTLASATLNGVALTSAQLDSIRLGTGTGVLIKSQDPTGTRTQAATTSGVIYKGETATLILTYSGATGTAPYTGQGFVKYNGVQILNLPNDELPTNNPATPAANDATVTPGCFTITGTVFKDLNGGTTPDGGVPSTSAPIYVNVIDPATGNVVAVVTVNATTGVYTVPSLNPGNYILQLTQVQGVAGNPKPATTLPDGFVHINSSTGNSTAPDDGNITNGETPVTIAAVNLTGVNFGIEQAPESIAGTKSITGAPQNGTTYSLSDTPLRGSDPQDQPVAGSWAGKTVAIDTLPTNGFELVYDGVTITTPGFRIPNYDPAKLSVKATAVPGGTSSTRFYFSTVDAAGVKDPSPATFTLNFSTALPVVFDWITASIADGELVINWKTLTEKNCSHYEIEASRDGVGFVKLGDVKTIAPGGNSDQALQYQFSRSVNGTMMWGIALFVLGLLLLIGGKRNKWLHLSVLCIGISVFAIGCNKNTKDILSDSSSRIYIRIKQVDIDHSVNYSKVVQVGQQ